MTIHDRRQPPPHRAAATTVAIHPVDNASAEKAAREMPVDSPTLR